MTHEQQMRMFARSFQLIPEQIHLHDTEHDDQAEHELQRRAEVARAFRGGAHARSKRRIVVVRLSRVTIKVRVPARTSSANENKTNKQTHKCKCRGICV